MPTTILLYSCIFVIGLAIGGFVNVCVDRFPKKISFRKKAFCENCNADLAWHDVIPVASFLLLKGRCRSCGAKVNIQYPIVELANGALYILVFMANGWNLQSILYCLMTSAFLVISIVDERTMEIPFPCNVFIGVLGILVCVLDILGVLTLDLRETAGISALSVSFGCLPLYLIGAVGAFVIMFILFQLGGMGGGDVYLMTAAGLMLGWKKITLAFFLACIVGSIIHIIRMKVSHKEHVLSMGPYLCFGLFVCALWGDAMIGWYLGTLHLN